jgi:DNA-binding transcriptional LysR family regulator
MNTPFIPPSFDWTLMRSFVAVMDEGSLQAAARKLRSSQPTISRHVALLEQQLGAILFERAGRQLMPTELAHGIAEHARVMQASANAIGVALTAKNKSISGTVRISASQTSSCYLLPPILKKLREQEPGIAIELVASNQMSDLLRREADIALRMVKPEEDSLIARHIGNVPIGIYAHADYLQRRPTPQNLEELLKHDLIGFDNCDSIILGFKMLGIDLNKNIFKLRCDDHMTLLHAVKAGMGIGFTGTYVGRSEVDLQRLLPDLPITPLQAWLTVHREIRCNSRIRLVYDFLADAIGAELSKEH